MSHGTLWFKDLFEANVLNQYEICTFVALRKNTSMMKYLSRILLITFVFVFSATYSHAESWRDKTELLIYSPRYFGPNAFPIPEMRDGQVSERIFQHFHIVRIFIGITLFVLILLFTHTDHVPLYSLQPLRVQALLYFHRFSASL